MHNSRWGRSYHHLRKLTGLVLANPCWGIHQATSQQLGLCLSERVWIQTSIHVFDLLAVNTSQAKWQKYGNGEKWLSVCLIFSPASRDLTELREVRAMCRTFTSCHLSPVCLHKGRVPFIADCHLLLCLWCLCSSVHIINQTSFSVELIYFKWHNRQNMERTCWLRDDCTLRAANRSTLLTYNKHTMLR